MTGSSKKPEPEIASLQARVDELEETLRAIQSGEVDALVISTASGEMIYTLENADQPYRLFVETMTEGAVTATQDGTILYCNTAFSAILRQPLEKIIGNSFSPYIAPDSRQSWNELWEKARSGVSVTEIFLRNDGRDIPVQMSMKPLSIAQGTGISIVVTDLTERKRDQKLIAEGNLATLILEHAGEALVVCDPGMTVLRSNPKADELFETPTVNTSLTHLLSSCTPLAVPVTSRVGAWAKTGVVPQQDQLIAASAGEGIELVVRRSHNDNKIILMRSTEIHDNRKELIGYLFIFIDITARKRDEDALRESEQRYRNLFENMQEGFAFCRMLYDKENRPTDFIYLNVNPMFNRIAGISGVEGKSATDVFPGIREAFPDLFEIYGRVALTGTPESLDLNFHPIKKWLHISVYSPVKEYFVAIFEDITERKTAEEVMRTFSEDLERKVIERTSDLSDVNQKLVTEIDVRLDAEKQLTKTVGEKEVLLREVHHRVKNNLQIIISLLNLQSRYMTDETTLSAFRESQNRIKAMALVHEKLYQSTDISKINLDNYLKFLGTNLLDFFGMKGKGITLTMDIKDISLAIDTAIPLGLMVNELISNSLKYAFPDGRKGEISLAIHRQDHALAILFKDTGVGIPQDFDWRNPKSLGLRLVISLVEQLQGTIELDRAAGTAFTIVVKEKE